MTYAGGRTILDADSHVMELADFLDDFIDPDHADQLRRRGMEALRPVLDAASAKAEARRADPAVAAEAEGSLLTDKGWSAMGGFDPQERSRVLDLLGFDAQLVFATFATAMFSLPRSLHRYDDQQKLARDLDLLYAGASAQNRAMAAFCADDVRLLPVGYVPLVDPARAVECAEEAITAGCPALMVPSTAAGERAPTHPELDDFWALLERTNTPFVLHVGGGGRLLDRAFHNNDMPVTDHLGGGENIRSKDYLAIHHSPATFLGVLILDGLFDRHPNLRGGCIEQGAGWVVSWMHHLDYAQRAFKRTEEPLRKLEGKPSDYVRKHLKFTPFPGEPVGWMMEQAGAELFMFSSDYPHPEGGRDPIAKFEAELEGVSEADRAMFYADNMSGLVGTRV
ncbi:MAG: amidohydrolase family protein [Actinobacteria bacterium]|nr:amidohydrolase family protein [Actinomycetota bacterium]MBV8958440.1 amidohydrolase family protein [Actinomycetota bacterium]MBV9663501.1 amidohydrolase family protein [Actinomycetota bacterium]MBV9935672.1 amidohydrolase family protein [Actinomycetota bacterium]